MFTGFRARLRACAVRRASSRSRFRAHGVRENACRPISCACASMRSGLSRSTPLGADPIPGHAGASPWHMLHRASTTLCASDATAEAAGMASADFASPPPGPALESSAMSAPHATVTPHVHHGDGSPLCCVLKKWRIETPITMTSARIAMNTWSRMREDSDCRSSRTRPATSGNCYAAISAYPWHRGSDPAPRPSVRRQPSSAGSE